VKDIYCNWFIDFSRDGFGAWNKVYTMYGFSDVTPVPADYDGDGYADLAVKSNDGVWYIDYHGVGSGDEYGFGYWDVSYSGYGYSNVIPVPADYDGDGKADLAIKTSDGYWMIDLSNNFYSTDYTLNQFGGWNLVFAGYGFSNATPTPAFYDQDPGPHQTADLSVWDGTTWYLDNSTQWTGGSQFGHWDLAFTPPNTGWTTTKPVPGDYDHDGVADLALFIVQSGQCWWLISDSSSNPRDTGHPYPVWNHYYNLTNR